MRCINLNIFDDMRVENNESFTFSLQSGSRTIIDESITVVNIQDDHDSENNETLD